MSKIETNGECSKCKTLISKEKAVKHIEDCIFSVENKNTEDYFLIKIYDESKIFWMYIAVPLKHELYGLDEFLRETWLECCGHLSMFKINGTIYEDCNERSYKEFGAMTGIRSVNSDIKVAKILGIGLIFTYEYDFGTTTELWLEVIGKYAGSSNNKIKLLMKNEMPNIICESCQEIAKNICSSCQSVTCKYKKCQKKHPCCEEGDDCFLPFVNSPRTGQCGYVG